MLRLLFISSALLLALAARGGATEAIWIGPANGNWSDPANWSTGIVPNSTTDVYIDFNPAQNSTIQAGADVTTRSLTIDAGDSLAIPNNTIDTTGGIAQINGTLSVSGTQSQVILPNVEVGPTGQLQLTKSTTLLNYLGYIAPGGLVHGGGTILTNSSTNDGEIRADLAAAPLSIPLGNFGTGFTNNGRLTATNGGWLKIAAQAPSGPGTFRGGRIEAYPNSRVTLGAPGSTAAIDDAVLASIDDTDPLTAAPIFELTGIVLSNPTIEGNIQFPANGGGASVQGTVTNHGQITLLAPTSGVPTYIGVSSDTFLSGGGSILSQAINGSPSSPTIFASTVSGSFTGRIYNLDNLIHGIGYINYSPGSNGPVAVTNRGTIDAEVASGSSDLVLSGTSTIGADINSGIMRSSGGGHLRLTSATIQNFEGGTLGKIIAGQNSIVELSAVTINGGILQFEGTDAATQGRLSIESGAVLQDVTIQGTLRTTSNASVTMQGQINNQGAIAAPITVTSTTTSLQLNGSGEVLAQNTWLTLANSARFTSEQNVIHGSGTVANTGNSTFINRGTIRADGALNLTTVKTMANSGRLEAASGGVLTLSSTEVTNYEGTVGGTIFAADGGTVNLGIVHGGTLATEGTGVINASNTSLDSVHNTGNLQMFNAKVAGNLVNDGSIKGNISLNNTTYITGTGQCEVTGNSNSALLLINGPQHTILGDGSVVNTTIQNQGTITAEGTSVFTYSGPSLQNSGMIRIPTGTTFSATAAAIDNTGTLQCDGATTIISNSGASGFTNRVGGTIRLGGTLTLGNGSFNITALNNAHGALFTGSGTLNQTEASSTPALVNDGIVAPGDGIKTLSVSGGFVQHAPGDLQIEIAGGASPTTDLLAIDGAATLAGALDVALAPSASIDLGNSFTVLTAKQWITGTFDQLTLPALGSALFWSVAYSTNDVRITATQLIPGDYNHDAVVDASDYTVWRQSLGSTTVLAADGNGDSVVDSADFDIWRAHFGDTASTNVGAVAAVPEPTLAVLALSCAVAGGCLRRRR